MVGEQPLHPVAHPRPILLRQLELAVQVAPVFILDRGHVHHAPHRLGTSRQVTPQQIEQRHEINAVCLGATLLAVHLDTRRVDHQALDPLGHQKAVQPEAVSTGFVAAHHPRLRLQAELRLGPLDLAHQRLLIARGDLPTQGLLAVGAREPEQPSRSRRAPSRASGSRVLR